MKSSRGLWLAAWLATSACLRAQSDAPRAAASAELPGSVQIRSVQYGLLLRPRDANNADGTPLVLYPAQPWKCMTWTVEATEAGGLTAGGVVKQTPFQADKVWRFEKLADGGWRILDPTDGKALTARDESTVAFDEWRDAPGQRWDVLPAPEHLTI